MKLCRACGETKPDGQFYKSARSKDGLLHRCRACIKERDLDGNLRPLAPRMEEVVGTGREYLAAIKETTPCMDCGQFYDPCAMDFDHVRGRKLFNLSQGRTTFEETVAEVDKCEIVCANCHRVRTKLRRDGTVQPWKCIPLRGSLTGKVSIARAHARQT
jgi:hypothetical protein